MKCPFCGEENLEGSTVCKNCKKSFEDEEVKEKQNVEKEQEVTSNLIKGENGNYEPPKAKKGNPILIVVVIIIALIAVFFYILWPSIVSSVNSQWKPVIYIYPPEETSVTITVDKPEVFTVTYPKYQEGWTVTAKPDGTLIDFKGREYYALYWEGETTKKNPIKKDGFVVKKEDTIPFLEEKLEILGLNEREADEFIMYWLPILEKSNYNYIRFQTMEEMNSVLTLNINPKPETYIRIRMEYKELEKPIKVKEQKLEKVERKGYTVVEWGGTKIN